MRTKGKICLIIIEIETFSVHLTISKSDNHQLIYNLIQEEKTQIGHSDSYIFDLNFIGSLNKIDIYFMFVCVCLIREFSFLVFKSISNLKGIRKFLISFKKY